MSRIKVALQNLEQLCSNITRFVSNMFLVVLRWAHRSIDHNLKAGKLVSKHGSILYK